MLTLLNNVKSGVVCLDLMVLHMACASRYMRRTTRRWTGHPIRMVFVSLTRLRIRSIRFLPLFAVQTTRSLRQVEVAPGFLEGALLPDRNWTYWTMTAWDCEESMRQYMITGSHKLVMPRLQHWCDEASVVHWLRPDATLPSWTEADRRMRESGRPSKVRSPSPQHASLTYEVPRTTGSVPIGSNRRR